MSPPPDLPLWRRALAIGLLITGLLLVCAAALMGTILPSWEFHIGGVVLGLGCAVLGCAIVAQRITCGRCGRSLICIGGRPSKYLTAKNCSACGTPFFSDGVGEVADVRKKGKRLLLVFAVLLPLYVGPYVALSRRGYAEADQWNMKGFYYFTPEDSDAWRLNNYGCMYLFRPLNVVDRWLGYGRPPGCEPLWGLSK